MTGYLVLEDGTVFRGRAFGYPGISGGEVVFNTAHTGYQEILTDPSYAGQIVCMTYPMIGNYGVNGQDVESKGLAVSGFLVRSYSSAHVHARASDSLGHYLESHKIVGLTEIDTRALTRRIRAQGSMRGVVGVSEQGPEALRRALAEVKPISEQDLVTRVATSKPYAWNTNSNHEIKPTEGWPLVVVIDFGVKQNMLRRLVDEGVRVEVVPPSWSHEQILALRPCGVLLSNGPGDPQKMQKASTTLLALLGRVPILGICLGHQLLARALGAQTYKLKFGHHGANHPVLHRASGRIEITSQNHQYAVDAQSLLEKSGGAFGPLEITHRHLTDDTVEGFALPSMKARAMQYHPEAAPGPHDASYVFQEFVEDVRGMHA